MLHPTPPRATHSVSYESARISAPLRLGCEPRPAIRDSKSREKQKLKRLYGVTERQLKRYFDQALKKKKDTGEVLLQLLETRLDNVVYRLGFVAGRSMARQLISHGHVLVDGKKVDIPSFNVKPGETMTVSTKALSLAFIKKSLSEKGKLPDWLEKKAAVGRLVRPPERIEVEADVNENLIVEFYSR